MENNGKTKRQFFLISDVQIKALEEYLLSVPMGQRTGREFLSILTGLGTLPALPDQMV